MKKEEEGGRRKEGLGGRRSSKALTNLDTLLYSALLLLRFLVLPVNLLMLLVILLVFANITGKFADIPGLIACKLITLVLYSYMLLFKHARVFFRGSSFRGSTRSKW